MMSYFLEDFIAVYLTDVSRSSIEIKSIYQELFKNVLFVNFHQLK